jgi:hypothetical protein
MGIGMETIERGKIIQRGKGSKAIPISKAISDLMEGLSVGDPYEMCLDNGRLILRFPKPEKPEKDVF